MSQVIAKLLEDHRRMTVLLEVLEREVKRFSEGVSLNFFLVEALLDYMMNFPQKCHHPIENLMLRSLSARDEARGAAAAEIFRDHDVITHLGMHFSDVFQQIKLQEPVPRELLVDAVQDYREFLLRHMEAEETIFFPAAEEVLYPSDWDVIETRLADKGDPVFGREADRQYRALHKVIVEWGER